MKQYIFAYGTLSNGPTPRKISQTLKKLKYVGDGFVYGRLYNLGDYPGAVLSRSPRNKVFGKIYELPDDPTVLTRLDEYEEFFPHQKSTSLFLRKRVPVKLINGEVIRSWVYVYNKDVRHSTIIPSGDFARITA